MSPRDLLNDPCWQGSDLGHPLPDHPHAVSVALPRWKDVIAYERHESQCRDALRTIYPRFGMHPLVAELSRQWPDVEWSVWPFPTTDAARAAEGHCRRRAPNARTQCRDVDDLTVLLCDASAAPHAKAFWQHTGLGTSSRQAAIALGRELAPPPETADLARLTVRRRLADIHGCDPGLISLHPSGMSALHAALNAVQAIHPGRPSNPLLRCIDLPAVSRLARDQGVPIIADDTIGTAINLSVLEHVDLLFTSLTKSFAGRGDVMAGSLLISPASPWHASLAVAVQPLAGLSDADAIALEAASRDVAVRVPKLDANCLALAERLEAHPAVASVMHPKNCTTFRDLMRPTAGFGCLLSFELNDGPLKAQRVYDALRVSKGPSLGTDFSLVCPYTLLAHYDELDWAESCGVPAHLLRVSVGLEDPDDLWERFKEALEA